ncbi:MAG: hypothetical protein D9V44_06580 [Actinobacteria bacterium]|nr:MAG: hypothetical protein D9V44_06580 [Actinomycetota bacterium]
MPYAPSRIWNPAAYQGGHVSKRYFEGWYYKLVDAPGRRSLALIPGVSFSPDGSARHAFVQLVPSGGTAHYFALPAAEFRANHRPPFDVRVGPSVFSRDGISLDIVDGERSIRGDVRFGGWMPWPVRLLSPGIMGPFRFVPGMETYHGVLSMDHDIEGWLEIDGETISFDGGRGYTEKDWGRSFPSSWIWAQSNTFEAPGTSLMLSVAKIPWMTGAFVGSIAGLLHNGELHRFATYTGAKVRCIETGQNEAHIILGDRREEIEVHLTGCDTLILKAPVLGAMEGHDAESLGGTLDVTLRSVRGGRASVRYRGVGRQAGIEIMNHDDELGRVPCGNRTTVA